MPISETQRREIEEAKSTTSTTKRPTVSALEEILYEPFEVLDHGFIRVIDYLGDDAAIVQAARVSYGKGTKKISEDAGLINYLMRHRHTTPFEMCEIKFHAKMPIFVARQWIRHRTANVNEYSARYSILDKEFYIPKQEHLGVQSTTNRQGRGNTLEGAEAQKVLELLRKDSEYVYEHYEYMLNDNGKGTPKDPERDMLARELARMNLSLNFYTQWYWKIDLHNLFHFLSLRADTHAQYEIRIYAEKMLEMVRRWVPIAHQAFLDHRLGSVILSAKAVEVVRKLVKGEEVSQETSGLSKREWGEFKVSLKM
jgi:thymidylate synthase (FAD)